MISLTRSFKRKFFRHRNLSKFLFIIVLTSLESAFPTAIHVNLDKDRGHKKTTNDIMKTKVDLDSVSVVYKVEAVANCKRIGKVKTSKIIELWQKKHACEIRINDLRREASFHNGNAMLLDVSELGCDVKEMSGTAYFCPSLDVTR